MLSHTDNTEDPAPQSSPSSTPPSALRAQRLSADEARAVIDLWQAERVEQTGLTDRPAVPDVAEGLDLSVEDVQRLLAEVRTRRDAEARLLAHEQELAEIRLAEEQRKLAEIRRQRAELERVVAEAGRQAKTQEDPSAHENVESIPFDRWKETEMQSSTQWPTEISPVHSAWLSSKTRKRQAGSPGKVVWFAFLVIFGLWWLLSGIANSMPLSPTFLH